jgi:hypothetical protein
MTGPLQKRKEIREAFVRKHHDRIGELIANSTRNAREEFVNNVARKELEYSSKTASSSILHSIKKTWCNIYNNGRWLAWILVILSVSCGTLHHGVPDQWANQEYWYYWRKSEVYYNKKQAILDSVKKARGFVSDSQVIYSMSLSQMMRFNNILDKSIFNRDRAWKILDSLTRVELEKYYKDRDTITYLYQ